MRRSGSTHFLSFNIAEIIPFTIMSGVQNATWSVADRTRYGESREQCCSCIARNQQCGLFSLYQLTTLSVEDRWG